MDLLLVGLTSGQQLGTGLPPYSLSFFKIQIYPLILAASPTLGICPMSESSQRDRKDGSLAECLVQ